MSKLNISKNRLVGLAVFLIVVFAISFNVISASRIHSEYYYQDKFCYGVKEHILSDKTRVDCLTSNEAQEFDFANKWAECVGQALYYGVMTARQPTCVLIKEYESDVRFIKRALVISRAYCNFNLKIMVVTNESIQTINSGRVCVNSASMSVN